jgi:hypothetical protein
MACRGFTGRARRAGRRYSSAAEDHLTEYLFARSTGHFASLMSLISRGCYRAIKTGAESLTARLLDEVRIDQAAEDARGQLQAAIEAGRLPARAGAADPADTKKAVAV